MKFNQAQTGADNNRSLKVWHLSDENKCIQNTEYK